ncbi:unnamed protein product [Lathyrus oleraceus]
MLELGWPRWPEMPKAAMPLASPF